MQAGHDALVGHVSDLSNHVQSKANDLTQHVNGFIDQGKGWMDDLGQNLGTEWPNMIQDHVNQAIEDVKNKIEQEIQTLIREAMDKVCGALDEFDQKLTGAKEGSSGARALLDPIFDQVKSVTSPVTDALESIKDAASMVGISL